MAGIRLLTSFLLIAVWLLTAHSHQGGNIVQDESKAFSARKGVLVVAATAARGRKIVVGKQELMLEKINEAASEEKIKGPSKQNTHKINEVAWSWSEQFGQKRDGRRSRSLLSKEINVGFFAFDTDYDGPRHHPPKNN